MPRVRRRTVQVSETNFAESQETTENRPDDPDPVPSRQCAHGDLVLALAMALFALSRDDPALRLEMVWGARRKN